MYVSGFEVSTLDGDIWLGCEPGCERSGEPNERHRGRSTHRVRVTGLLYAKPGARYGHLGSCGFQLDASKIEYLGRPDAQ